MQSQTRIKISLLYRLGNVHSVKKLHTGLQTPKFVFETERGKFVVSTPKLSNSQKVISKSKDSLLLEIALLNILKDLPVPHYIASSRHNFVEKIDGCWVTVDKFIPGSKPKHITPNMAYQLGNFLGEFHREGKKFKKNLSKRRRFYDLNKKMMRLMEIYAEKQDNRILKSVVNEIRMGVEKNLPPAYLPKGPIHVDIKPDNELFVKGKLSGVLDFGNFYVDCLMIDIGKTIMWNCVKNSQVDKKLLSAFMNGYQDKRKLSRTEFRYLKKSILYAIYSHIWVDLYHVPLGYVPESYTLSLVKNFLPVARRMAAGKGGI